MFSWKLCLSVQLVLLSSHPDPPLPPPPPPASDLSSPSLESGFMGLLRVKLFPLAFLSSPFLCKQPGLLSVVPLLLSSMLSWVQSLLQALLCGGLITWASFPSSVGLSCLLLVFADNLLSCFAFFFSCVCIGRFWLPVRLGFVLVEERWKCWYLPWGIVLWEHLQSQHLALPFLPWAQVPGAAGTQAELIGPFESLVAEKLLDLVS